VTEELELQAYLQRIGYDGGLDHPIKRLLGDSADQFIAVKARWLLRQEPGLTQGGLSLLDYGCGAGDLMRVLAGLGARASFTGCDVSGGMLAEAARRFEAAGLDGIDLNMGCPVRKIVSKGHGSALMRDPLAAAVIFRTVRKAIRIPFTIKIRGGWDEHTLNAVEIARLAESEGVDAITVHPRTRSQQFTGRAPWEIIAAVVAAVRLPVVGNGDVHSLEDARAMVAATGCAAVMIGRGALGAPWIFRGEPVDYDGRAAIIRRHADLIEAHMPERVALVQLKKHLAWYSTGLPGSAAVRPRLFAATSAAQVRALFWDLWTT